MSKFKVYTDRDGELWLRRGKRVRYLCNCCALTEIAKRDRSFKAAKADWGLVRVGKPVKTDGFGL